MSLFSATNCIGGNNAENCFDYITSPKFSLPIPILNTSVPPTQLWLLEGVCVSVGGIASP